jgi:hypothetical protein
MFWMMYTLYVDALIFVRRNIFAVLPFYFYQAGNFLLGLWLPKDFFLESFFKAFVPLLCYCMLETYVIVVVYKREMIFDPGESAAQIINRLSGSILLLTVTVGLILVLLVFVYVLLTHITNFALGKPLMAFAVFFLAIAYLLSLRHLIYHDPILVMTSIKAGMKGLYKNFFFYLILLLLGGVLTRFPSALFPASWALSPFLPAAELNNNLVYGGGINWLHLMIDPILTAMTSIALTSAFLTKDRIENHAS